MKTRTYSFSIIFLFFSATFFFSCSKQQSARETIKFTKDWKFTLGDSQDFKNPQFDDSNWRILNLPHDWSIEGEFKQDNPSTPGGASLPGGIGWYRKTFDVPETDKGKLIFIDFDGVYRNSEVWINGQYLGKRPYGYSSFRYELTPYLNFGGKNVLAAKVDNSEQSNSRWYSGSGIYRNVWLVKTGKVFVENWGTFITTPEVNKERALVVIKTKIKNQAGVKGDLKFKTTILNPSGKSVINAETKVEPWNNNIDEFTHEIKIEQPALWSVENPQMYKAITEVYFDGKHTDTYETPFGIRFFNFDSNDGFSLNGEKMKIKGVCQHHDLGCLGAAINTRALERQLEILREMGCNSIRTSHNPPAPELLDLCDKMGFIVMDESFDMWRKKKTQFDYSRDFPKWHERDLTDLILRDRNHPSVMIWSIGNEVLEQWDHVNADTLSVQQANLILNFDKNVPDSVIKSGTLSVNSLLTIKLYNIVKSLDTTRPVTSGCNEVNPWNNLFKANILDLYGFNYHVPKYAAFHDSFPGKKLIITEAVSGLQTRGFYMMPSDSMFVWPHRGPTAGIPFGNPEYQCSAYDNCHAPWGSTHEESWLTVKKYPHIAGTYLWSGFDYLGEPTPYWWPPRSSYFGVIDLAGFPKDVYYMYQSEWNNKAMLHVFPHWNWQPGQVVDVWAYYSDADEVELFLNGKSLGAKSKTVDQVHVFWRIPFEPGTIKAVSRKAGKVVLEKEIKTAGKPTQLSATADRAEISADGEDLSFIAVEVVDENGIVVPDAGNQVKFEIEGNAKIVGVDNGNPVSHESLKGSTIKAFNGKCLVVVQAGEKPGKATLSASADGLKSGKIKISLK
jgi:beta-galactosidase